MSEKAIQPGSTVEQTLQRFPAVAVVFVRLGMACVGCAMAAYDTLDDAARAYGRDPAELVAELDAAAAQADRDRQPPFGATKGDER